MEQRTKIDAPEGKQELTITRAFNLPVALLFRAHAEAELIGQWMGTNVLKFDGKKHGSYQFETVREGNVVFRAHGTIHECTANKKIVRTFEMENVLASAVRFGVQLEIYEFEKITDISSRLTIHTIFESVAQRDQLLQLPFAQGINRAHNRLQDIAGNLN